MPSKLSKSLKVEYARVAAMMETETGLFEGDSGVGPGELMKFGLAEAERCSRKRGIPTMSYGYMVSDEWLARLAIEKKLCYVDEDDPTCAPSDPAYSAAVRIQARSSGYAPMFMMLPESRLQVVILCFGGNTSEEDMQDAKNEKTKIRFQEMLGVDLEPRWFIDAWAGY